MVASITPDELAERLRRAEPMTLLDVRDDATGTIDAETATVAHVPAAEILADPAAAASALPGPITVVCQRGISARAVAEALDAAGVQAGILEGGMRGWLGALQARPVELGVAGLAVRQVQRPPAARR